MTFKVIQYR